MKKTVITGKELELIGDKLGIPILGFCYYLGLYSASYTRVVKMNGDKPVEHAVALLARYLQLAYPNIPVSVGRLLQASQNREAPTQLDFLKSLYNKSEMVLKIGGTIVDLERDGNLAALVGRAKMTVYQYQQKRTGKLPITVSNWLVIIVDAFERGDSNTLGYIEKAIDQESEAHGIEFHRLLSTGWGRKTDTV